MFADNIPVVFLNLTKYAITLSLESIINNAIFSEDYDEMVLIKEKVSQIEKKVSKRILPKKKPRKNKKNK